MRIAFVPSVGCAPQAIAECVQHEGRGASLRTTDGRLYSGSLVIEPTGVVTTDTVVWEPWTDGHAVGFKVTRHSDGAVGYVYLNPSVDEDTPGSTPDVFVYGGPNGDPGQDASWHYYDITADGIFGTSEAV